MATLALENGELVNLDEHNIVPRVAVSVEVNSKGQYLWKASIYDAESVDRATKMLDEAVANLKKRFGEPE